mgnify:FL=1
MAYNFQLIDKTNNEAIELSLVDELICKEVLNVIPHERFYGGSGKNSFNWFDSIGFQIASGRTLENGDNSVRKYYQESEMWKPELPVIEQIIDFLQQKYTTKNWVSWGKN